MAVSRRFADIDLSQLVEIPAPLDYDAILDARMAEITDRLVAAGIPYNAGAVKGDTVAIIQRASANREALVRHAQWDAIRAVLLATSWGPYLDHLGATQIPPVARLILIPETETAAAVLEADDDFRARIQLAPEALSTAGPEGAYLFFALATEGVKAASCYGPMSYGGTPEAPFTSPGRVRVPIVAAAGDGTASPELIAAVQAALSADDRRPIADWVTVEAAEIVPYAVDVTLYVGPGVDRALVKARAEERLAVQARRQHRPGAIQKLTLLAAAAAVPGAAGASLVDDMVFASPAADVNAEAITPAEPEAAYRAPYCTGITVTVEVGDG